MSSITVHSYQEAVADYISIPAKKIRDLNPVRKRGVSDYYICAYLYKKKWVFYAHINACWFMDTNPSFQTLREASDWIRKYMYP